MIAPVNPNAREVMGIKSYRSVSEMGAVPDMVVVAVRAPSDWKTRLSRKLI